MYLEDCRIDSRSSIPSSRYLVSFGRLHFKWTPSCLSTLQNVLKWTWMRLSRGPQAFCAYKMTSLFGKTEEHNCNLLNLMIQRRPCTWQQNITGQVSQIRSYWTIHSANGIKPDLGKRIKKPFTCLHLGRFPRPIIFSGYDKFKQPLKQYQPHTQWTQHAPPMFQVSSLFSCPGRCL